MKLSIKLFKTISDTAHIFAFPFQGKGAMVTYWLHSMHWQTREQFLEEGKKRRHRRKQAEAKDKDREENESTSSKDPEK